MPMPIQNECAPMPLADQLRSIADQVEKETDHNRGLRADGRIDAWYKVADQVQKGRPGLLSGPGTGLDLILNEIVRLQQRDRVLTDLEGTIERRNKAAHALVIELSSWIGSRG